MTIRATESYFRSNVCNYFGLEMLLTFISYFPLYSLLRDITIE